MKIRFKKGHKPTPPEIAAKVIAALEARIGASEVNRKVKRMISQVCEDEDVAIETHDGWCVDIQDHSQDKSFDGSSFTPSNVVEVNVYKQVL